MRTHILLFIAFLSANLSFAQQLDPIHYPQESEWEYLMTKQTDSLIQVMKFYFNSDDTLFLREASSQQVVKVALTDLQTPGFYLGTRYTFAARFYGPDGPNASRSSKNEKLDRFYYYYLNAPELKFTKVTLENEKEDVTTTKVDTPPPSTGAVIKSNPTPEENSQSYSALRPQILLKNGCVIYPEKFYFLSDGQLYFGNGVRNNIYKVDTAAVQAVIGIEVGKNLNLTSKAGYELGGRIIRGAGIFFGAISTVIVASAVTWEFDGAFAFFATIPTGIVYAKMIINGTQRIQNKRRFRHARYAQCSN